MQGALGTVTRVLHFNGVVRIKGLIGECSRDNRRSMNGVSSFKEFFYTVELKNGEKLEQFVGSRKEGAPFHSLIFQFFSVFLYIYAYLWWNLRHQEEKLLVQDHKADKGSQ